MKAACTVAVELGEVPLQNIVTRSQKARHENDPHA
jgi:hypothetical protein